MQRCTSTYVMNEGRAESASEEEATAVILPEETWDDGGQDVGHEDEEPDVVVVLPADDWIPAEIGNVGDTRLAAGLDEHPANVGPEETLVGGVRIKVGVGVAMVCTVTTRPPLDRPLDGTSTSECQSIFKRLGGVVGTMRPQSVVA